MLRFSLLPALLVAASSISSHRAPDAAMKVDFTINGGGHTNERVQIRDVYPDVQAPFARYHNSGILFGIDKPILELRAGNLGPKLWAIHLVLQNNGGAKPMGVVSAQPALIYNGDNTPRQQSWFPMIILPPVRQGTLAVTLLSGGPAGRVRGTFAGTLVDDQGKDVTITNGTFDLARQPDM